MKIQDGYENLILAASEFSQCVFDASHCSTLTCLDCHGGVWDGEKAADLRDVGKASI